MADDQEALKWATSVFRDNTVANRYALYGRYARGDQYLQFATPKYAATFGTLMREFSYNRCAAVIDFFADRLQVERFTAEADGASETAGDLWRRNRMDARAGEVHKAALRDGDAYVIVWPETGTANGDQGAFPQFWPQKSSEIRVRYDDEEPGKITMAVKTWLLSDKRRRLNLYFPDRIEKYITKGRSEAVTPTALMRYQAPNDADWPVQNPWGTVPVFHFANNADTGAYGTSELRDVIPLQDGLNKVLTDLILASELTAYAIKVLLGFDAQDPNVMEAAARIETGRSKMLVVPPGPAGEKPTIDEFSAENLMQIISSVELFDKLISRVSKVPVHHLQMTGDFPSGRAMRTAEGPSTSKSEDQQTNFGNDWEDAMHLALRQMGIADPGMLTTVWKPASPLSKEDALDVALQQSAIGIPFEQIVRELGYDEEEIKAMLAEKDAAVDRQMQMDVALTGVGGGNDDQEPAA